VIPACVEKGVRPVRVVSPYVLRERGQRGSAGKLCGQSTGGSPRAEHARPPTGFYSKGDGIAAAVLMVTNWRGLTTLLKPQ
jgi:hypothetical protein